jgi:long-chain acyl-CoA synthetase
VRLYDDPGSEESFEFGVSPMNVGDLVDRAADLWGQQPAIHDEAGTLRFADLHREVERLAQQLRASGLARRSGLGLVAGNGRGFLIGLFAGLKCGAIVLPMAPGMKEREVQDVIGQSGVHFMLAEGEGSFRLTRTRIDPALPIAPYVDDPAVVRFTSGTTADAKGVVLSHKSVMERIAAANQGLELGSGDTVLWVLPMAYHFIVSIILYVFCGAAIAVANNLDAAAIIAVSNRHRATFLYSSPVHIQVLTAHRGASPLETLRRVVSTTSGISADACRRFTKRHGLDVCQAFGIIEVGLPIMNQGHAAASPEAIGVALDDYSIGILDQDLRAVAPGTIGRLAIKGPGMFDGYLMPWLSRDEVLRAGWFLTGDLAQKNADGVIRLAGREKLAINVAGNKVFPEEVEHVLLDHPLVSRCRVSGRAQALIGEYVVAEVQCKEGERANVADLTNWCRSRLSVHKVPRVIKIVDFISLTPSGKVMRS